MIILLFLSINLNIENYMIPQMQDNGEMSSQRIRRWQNIVSPLFV